MINRLNKILASIKNEDDFKSFLGQIDLIQQAIPGLFKAGMRDDAAKSLLLKTANYCVGKYQYQNRHELLISKPYALIIDPSNNCSLHCPGCLHNKKFHDKMGIDWPSGILNKETFNHFINNFGPYASTILFYNWGEPLINKHTPDFIRQAKKHQLNTSLSTNLSVKFDAEDLVLSGLDYMILSIDGVTCSTYEHYRQGGDFDLVFENVRRLVAVKKKYKVSTPRLSWQFLLFEHNKHEVEAAKKMACDLEVNEIRFARPYDIIWEPDLQNANNVEEEIFSVPRPGGGRNVIEAKISSSFSELLKHKWVDKIKNTDKNLFTRRSGPTCQWLYSSLVMDATGRYLPCCYAPRINSGYTWVFGDQEGRSPFNSEYYRFSRKHFVWLSELKKAGGIAPILKENKPATYCVACPNRRTKPLVNDYHLQRYLCKLDQYSLLTENNIKQITNWDN